MLKYILNLMSIWVTLFFRIRFDCEQSVFCSNIWVEEHKTSEGLWACQCDNEATSCIACVAGGSGCACETFCAEAANSLAG